MRIDPLLYSLYISSYAAVRLSHLLPETDICGDLHDILLQQCTILAGMLEGDRFMMKDIEKFIEQCQLLSEQAEELDAVQE